MLSTMRKKHRQTLRRVFERPTPAGIPWSDLEAMLVSCGIEASERSGSRVLLKKDADRIVIHRPHPEPVVGRATVRDIREFLNAVGIEP